MAKAKSKKRAATKTLSPKQMKKVKGGIVLSAASSGMSAKVPTIR